MAIQNPMPGYGPTEDDQIMEFATRLSSILQDLPQASVPETTTQMPPAPGDEMQEPFAEEPIAQTPADERIQAARSALENQNARRAGEIV